MYWCTKKINYMYNSKCANTRSSCVGEMTLWHIGRGCSVSYTRLKIKTFPMYGDIWDTLYTLCI